MPRPKFAGPPDRRFYGSAIRISLRSKEQSEQVQAGRAQQERASIAENNAKRGRRRKKLAVNAATEAATDVKTAAEIEQVTDVKVKTVTGIVTGAVTALQARAECEVNASTLIKCMPWLCQLEPGPSWVY
jgi:hypothetical protein